MIKKGDWNQLLIATGRPGTGKSTWALKRATELAKQSYVIAYDPAYSLPASIPGRGPAPIVRYEDKSGVRSALADKGSQGKVHAWMVGTVVEAISFAEELAGKSLSHGQGDRGFPVTLVMDEGVLLLSDNPTETKAALRRAISLRRHRHVGYIVTIQHGRMLDYQFFGSATEIAVFQTTDKQGLLALREAAGMPGHAAQMAEQLKRHEFITYKPGADLITHTLPDGKSAEIRTHRQQQTMMDFK